MFRGFGLFENPEACLFFRDTPQEKTQSHCPAPIIGPSPPRALTARAPTDPKMRAQACLALDNCRGGSGDQAFLGLRRPQETGTQDVEGIRGVDPAAGGRTYVDSIVVPAAPPKDPGGGRCGSFWVGDRTCRVRSIPVPDPLPDVPAHVRETKSTIWAIETSYRGRAFPSVIGSVLSRTVPPRVDAAICSPCRLFPFYFIFNSKVYMSMRRFNFYNNLGYKSEFNKLLFYIEVLKLK